jgi:ribonuclease HI
LGVVRAGVAAILFSLLRIKLCYTARLQFSSEAGKCTNKIIEYKAILPLLHKLRAIGDHRCTSAQSSKWLLDKYKRNASPGNLPLKDI